MYFYKVLLFVFNALLNCTAAFSKYFLTQCIIVTQKRFTQEILEF